jgi:nicotinamidase-related amidase
MKPYGRASFVAAPALLCLDLQREQTAATGLEPEDARRCIEQCRRVLQHARAAGWQVAHVHRHDGSLAGTSRQSPPIEGLEPRPREPVFYRDRPSAFSSASFRDFVSRLGDPRLIVVGFSLQASVLFTAVASHELGVPLTVVQGALAAPASRRFSGEVIETVLLSVLSSFAEVVSADQLLQATGPLLAQAANHPEEPGMGAENLRGLGEVSVDHLREYILDLVQELASVAARRGDSSSAEALHTCWSQIREDEAQH